GDRAREAQGPEGGARAGEAIDEPGLGDRLHPGPHERHDLPGKEEPIVSVPQGAEDRGEGHGCAVVLRSSGRLSQNPGGRSSTTPKARSRASPARPSVPSSNRRPMSVMPWGTRRGGENRGRGCSGSGAQSLRACSTLTKPARTVSDGWPVWLEIVSISSRSDGTKRRSTSRKRRAISPATIRRMRSAWTKSTAERKRDWRKMFGQASGTCTLSASTPRESVSSSNAAAASAKRITFSEP